MRRKTFTNYLTLVLMVSLLSGCDTLVSTSYRGESRLRLRVGVVRSENDSAEMVVPALAKVEESRVLFRAVEHRPTLAGEFQIDVYDAPAPDRLGPLDPFRAPDVIVAREHIGAVIPRRVDEPLELNGKLIPIYPTCWQGSCDLLPGAMATACDDDDQECLDRQWQCPGGMCQILRDEKILPDGVEDVIGFSNDYLVLYTAERIPAGSWAALKLGAPAGLDPGYHLAKNATPSKGSSAEAYVCLDEAATEVFQRFNAEHGTSYDPHELRCLDGSDPSVSCEPTRGPQGADRSQLSAALVAEEIDRGCLELAPTLEFVRDPAKELVAVHISGKAPSWVPSVAPVGQPLEEVDCPSVRDPNSGERKPVDLVVRLDSYAGSLCPEESLIFADDSSSFGVAGFGTFTGSGTCDMNFSLTVPAGYRFRRPRCLVQGETNSETDRAHPTWVTVTYAMAGAAMSSHHDVLPSLQGDLFVLMDTPPISVPECSDACEPQELQLTISVDVEAPEATSTWLFDVSCLDMVGVEWTTCSSDFAAR